jgi:hypothetical protein
MRPDRPYFHRSTEQLVELFDANPSDDSALEALRAELGHRSAARARALRAEVDARLEDLSQGDEGSEDEREPLNDDGPSEDPSDSPDDDEYEPGETSRPGGAPDRRDLPPDDRRRPSRFTLVQHPGISPRPAKYTPTLSRDLVLDAPRGASRARRFSAALDALVTEMKAKGTGSRSFVLNDGRATDLGVDGFGYTFDFVDEADIFEEARVEVVLGSRRCSGSVVALLPGRIVLCLDVNLGPRERGDFHFEFTTLRFRSLEEHGTWEGRSRIVPR